MAQAAGADHPGYRQDTLPGKLDPGRHGSPVSAL